jgi:4-amino-4-deoxy-L-arabinose transferase-like glycosyltransferase
MAELREPHPSYVSSWYGRVALIVVVCWFCGPLFIDLGEWDLQSDEAIYAYAVDRMLETGDWMTPRTIRFDTPFLEKPPLKLWLIAGAIRAGLLPQDEYGFRFFDALFGAIAFVYVFWLGRSLSGWLCGVVAVLVLFTLPDLLFDHGLRSNNMDAALVLAYCGGVFHFARWVEQADRTRSPIHAAAAALYFTLGFMTKFVAVAFLPLVCVLSVWWNSDTRLRARAHWRDWILPALLAAAAIAPWFVYQAAHAEGLWQTIWRDQVFARFTGEMDPRRLLPWHYYVSWLSGQAISAGSQWIALLGLFTLGAQAWRGRPWMARLLLLWLILPIAVLSLGTSKFLHYMYPFLPPLALGAGAAAATLVVIIERLIARIATAATGHRLQLTPTLRSHTRAQRVMVAGGLLAAALAVWTASAGRVVVEIGGIGVLRNSSVVRPLVIAAILFVVSRHAWIVGHALAIAAVAIILPVSAYTRTLNELSLVDHPLRALSDCALTMPAARPETRAYLHYYQLLNHSPYYYLRRVGPWDEQGTGLTNDELDRRLYEPGRQAFTILSSSDYDRFAPGIVARDLAIPAGVALEVNLVLLTPGPFQACGRAAVAAGGEGAGALATPERR